ncbi:MAG: CPBP family intramembrane metalloprotease [Paracoccaceae bacterium]|nr:CPBP family intramembrane metalloprotease [Paracoccaceae bacterium]
MNRRLAIALAAFVVWIAITIIGGNITTGGEGSLLDSVQSGIGWTWVVAAGFILAVVLWQGWHDVALNRWADVRGWRLTWLPMIYIVGALGFATFMGLPPVTALLIILVNTLLVGFSEELMLRGAVLQGFRHATSIWPAVLLTSVAFGAMHSLNVFVTGDLQAALVQSCAAFLSGLVFIALRLRTGSLWPPIIVHALWDFATFTLGAAGHQAAHGNLPAEAVTPAAASGLSLFLPILLVLPNAIYGLWLMRNIGRTHVNPDT